MLVFLKFGAVFLNFFQNQTRPFLWSKFYYYLILGSNKEFLVDITHFDLIFTKYHFSLNLRQFLYTLQTPNSPIFFVKNFLLSYLGTKLGVSDWYYLFRSNFHKIKIFLKFRAIFVEFAQKRTNPFFCPNFVNIISWGEIRFSG